MKIVFKDLTNLPKECNSLKIYIISFFNKYHKDWRNFILNSSGPGVLFPLHDFKSSNTSSSVKSTSKICLLFYEIILNSRSSNLGLTIRSSVYGLEKWHLTASLSFLLPLIFLSSNLTSSI